MKTPKTIRPEPILTRARTTTALFEDSKEHRTMKKMMFAANVMVIALSLTALSACTETAYEGEEGNGDAATCTGTELAIESDAYCVYEQAVIVEEGFECPEDSPFLHELSELGICSPNENESSERLNEVAERYEGGDQQIEVRPTELEASNFNGQCMENVLGEPMPIPEILAVEDLGAGLVAVEHSGIVANCCAELSVVATADTEGFTASIEYEESGELCDCECVFELSYTLGQFEDGTWTISSGEASATVTVFEE